VLRYSVLIDNRIKDGTQNARISARDKSCVSAIAFHNFLLRRHASFILRFLLLDGNRRQNLEVLLCVMLLRRLQKSPVTTWRHFEATICLPIEYSGSGEDMVIDELDLNGIR
jgi:hypothetical protein